MSLITKKTNQTNENPHFSIPHLNWNSNKKCFEILDPTTDRKIISFLFRSVMPTCFFSNKELLSTDSWSKKEVSHFKPLFLEKIKRESQKHITECPIEEYKATVSAFYEDLSRQISDLNMNTEVSKDIALLSLKKTCTDCFKRLFAKQPLNMPQIQFQDLKEKNTEYLNALYQGQCYHFAFYLTEEYKAMLSMIPFESSCNGAFLLYPKFFIQQLGYTETQTPQKGDLVLYLGDAKADNNLRFKHLGVLTDRGTIKSCWGNFGCQFEHQISQVPDAYGSDVIFFHKTHPTPKSFNRITQITNQMSDIIIKFKSPDIPSPLSNNGALLFLLSELKAACQKAYPASKRWDWTKIEENLLREVNPPTMNRTNLCKEFQNWMQEILPDYFVC